MATNSTQIAFPKEIYVYPIMGSFFIAERLEDIPDTSKVVAVYQISSVGNFRREVKFEIVDNKS